MRFNSDLPRTAITINAKPKYIGIYFVITANPKISEAIVGITQLSFLDSNAIAIASISKPMCNTSAVLEVANATNNGFRMIRLDQK